MFLFRSVCCFHEPFLRKSFSRMSAALAALPLIATATAPQETFLPPQNIPLPGTMTVSKMVVADVNGDHYDDLVAIGVDSTGVVIDIYLNEGKTRGTSEAVNFSKQRLNLKLHSDADAIADKVRFSNGFDLQVVDLDNDGYLDILASSASTGEIFVLWNQGPDASTPYVFTADTADPASTSMTVVSPLATHLSTGVGEEDVLGTPIYVTAADLGNRSGYKSIVAYHGGLQPAPSDPDPNSRLHYSPFNQRNYEALAIFYPYGPIGGRGFSFAGQRDKWLSYDKSVSCDLSLGVKYTCPDWKDGMQVDSEVDFFYNFRVSDENGRSNLNFAEAPSDILQTDGFLNIGTPRQTYQAGVYRPNASPGLEVLKGHGPDGSDSIWMQGGGKTNEFVADNDLVLMRRRIAIDTVLGNERSAGSTFGTLSTGATALITAGGMRIVYDLSDPTSAVDQSVPDYLNRDGQIGAWLGWAVLDSGPALLSLSDYCRFPDPCAKQLYWYHLPLDGSAPPKYIWGGARTLVMLDFAQETSTAQFKPFFQAPDAASFQAFTVQSGGAVTNKPFTAAGHFASPTESALLMLDHADGDSTNPAWNHLALYRPDTSKTYVSPTPDLEGLTVGRYIEDGLADIGITLPQGEVSAVLVGAHLGTDTPDGIRYVTVHDKATGTMKGIFPANPAETVKEIGKDGVVVPGLSTLEVGNYTLEVHNATAMASMNLNVINAYGITTTDFDWHASSACGLLPNTKDADLWPKKIAVSVTNFPGAVQAVRWMNQDDGTVVNLGSEGATYDAATSAVTLIVPQGNRLKDGNWRPAIEAGGTWQPIKRTWNVARDTATLASCAQQVNLVNEEAYSQCTDNDYYLDPAQYKVWPHLVNGSFRFFGSGFGLNQIKSAAIKQGSHRYFSVSLQLINDNEIDVEFGDLSALTPDAETALWFYSETGDVVEANGVPASGGKTSWRTARSGTCVPKLPQITNILNTGSGKDGTFQLGDVIKVSGANLLYPVPTATKLVLKGDDGAMYVLDTPRLPDDFDSTHYDNNNLVLYFTVPDDLTTAKIDDESYRFKPAVVPAGLVVAGSGALATTALSEGGLAALMSNPVTAVATLGATATGMSIYAGVENSIWLYEKVTVAITKPTPPPTDIDRPGKAGDDQPRDQPRLYLATYITDNNYDEDPNLYTIVFESTPNGWGPAVDVSSAIWKQGRGKYYNERAARPAYRPCDHEFGGSVSGPLACVLSIVPLAPGSNPSGVTVPYEAGLWNLFYIPYGAYVGTVERAAVAMPDILNYVTNISRDDQFLWRFATPINYKWIYTASYSKFLVTDKSNDCTLWVSRDDYCYQKAAAP